jgi:hypothetical protein
MSILVRTVTKTVRRIGTQPYDERNGRNECDQTITELPRAQMSGTTLIEDVKRSLPIASGQLVSKYLIINGN